MSSNFLSGSFFVGHDNLDVMRNMNSRTIDLIVTDPPFNTGEHWNGQKGTVSNGIKFEDVWDWNKHIDIDWLKQLKEANAHLYAVVMMAKDHHSPQMGAFIGYMGIRVVEMRRLIKDYGSIYIQCDTFATHYIRMMLDAIFGKKCFRNEIVWTYGLGGSSPRMYSKKHDTIFFYTKSSSDKGYYFDKPQVEATSQLLKGKLKGQTDVITHIPSLNNMSKERIGYPTQKPIALAKLMIAASCPNDGVVLDPFAGSGATLKAAESEGRDWVGIDINHYNTEFSGVIEDSFRIGTTKLKIITQPPRRTDEKDDNTFTLQPVPYINDTELPKHKLRQMHIDKFGGGCRCCGKPSSEGEKDLDRIIPGKHGGKYTFNNTQLLCGDVCHPAKKDLLVSLDDMKQACAEEGLMWNQRNDLLYSGRTDYDWQQARLNFRNKVAGK